MSKYCKGCKVDKTGVKKHKESVLCNKCKKS